MKNKKCMHTQTVIISFKLLKSITLFKYMNL